MRSKLLLAAIFSGLLLPAAQHPPKPGVKTPGVRVPMTQLKPEAVYEIPGAPDWIAVGESVYVSNKPKNSITKIDVKENKVAATITVGSKPCSGLAIGFGSLWVPLCGDNAVARVDLKTDKVTATIPITIGDSEGGLATGAGSVWILTDKKGTLARIDPDTNKVITEIRLVPGSYTAAFGEDAVWVTSTGQNLLIRVDPHTNLVTEQIKVGKKPRFLTIGGGFVWTLNQEDGSVTKVDPKTNKVAATIETGVPGEGGDIAYGEGSVWVTGFEFPISRIDPELNKVVQQFAGEGGDAIRAGLGSVWLCNLMKGTMWRIDPKRIAATLPE